MNEAHLAQLKNEAKLSLTKWQDAIMDELQLLAENISDTQNNLWIFVSEEDENYDFEVENENLLTAQLATPVGVHSFDATSVETTTWVSLMQLWTQLLESVRHTYAIEVPPNLVVDIQARTLAAWAPYFCPDIGPVPHLVLDITTVEEHIAETNDPFAQLLLDHEENLDTIEARIGGLMDEYGIAPPTLQGHEPGDCISYDES